MSVFLTFIECTDLSTNYIVVFEKNRRKNTMGCNKIDYQYNRGKLNKQHQLSSTFIFLISGAVATCENVYVVTALNILLILIFES